MAHVFKIKFGDTLRRLNVPMHYDELTPGWTFSELEAKVRELFSIPRTSQLVITYKDADNDIVTMADDQDLIDACIVQRLNPLRLEVKALAVPDSIEIPPVTIGFPPAIKIPFVNVEFPRAIPIPSVNVESPPAIPIPLVNVEFPPAIPIPSVNVEFPPAIRIPLVKIEIPPAVTIPPVSVEIPPAITIPQVKFEIPPAVPIEIPPAITVPPLTEFSVENLLQGILPESTLQATRKILDHYPPCLFTTVPARILPEALDTFLRNLTAYGVTPVTSEQQAPPSASNFNQDRASAIPSPPMTESSVENVLRGIFPESTAEAVRQILNRYPPSLFATMPAGVLPEALDSFLRNLTGYGAMPATEQHAACMASSFDQPGPEREYNKPEAPSRILHEFVQCDGCEMVPIEGPRYKSIKKHDYDLCSSCFKNMGNEADYHRMDQPMIFTNHVQYPSALRMGMEHQPMRLSPPRATFSQESRGWRPEKSPQNLPDGIKVSENTNKKLDSQFVMDVTIFDGTELAPGTKFTKIWRLKNVGTLPWPQQTKLVHIGGDVFSSNDVVSLELPEGGLPCGEEINISLDLRAPESTGRHVSQWCLLAPSGQRFGHRVWVLIQVVPLGEELTQVQQFIDKEMGSKDIEVPLYEGTASSQGTVDNAAANGILFAEGQSIGDLASVFAESADGLDKVFAGADSSLVVPLIEEIESAKSSSSAGPMTDSEDQQDEEIDELDGFSIVENPLMNNARSGETVVEYDFVDLLNSEPAFQGSLKEIPEFVPELQLGHVKESDFDKPPSGGLGIAQQDMQAFLQEFTLEKLKSMGFVQRDLNIELLQKNNYNLQQTMDDLVTSAKWDNILKDLEEMGFYDTQTNRRLLFKNEGSMKRVVKELVEIEKQMSRGKGKEKAA